MTITQTVEIPADRRLTIEVPREIPAGKTILAFTPVASIPQIETEKLNNTEKIFLSKLIINEMLQDETVRYLTGILHTDMSLEEIREERLAKYLK